MPSTHTPHNRSTTYPFAFYQGNKLLRTELFFGETEEEALGFAETWAQREFKSKTITIKKGKRRGKQQAARR